MSSLELDKEDLSRRVARLEEELAARNAEVRPLVRPRIVGPNLDYQ